MLRPWTTLVAALVVATGVGLAGARHVEAPSLGAELLAASTRVSPTRTAVLVLQPRDCESRLEALAVLVTEAARAGARVVVRVPGDAAAQHAVRARLLAMGWPHLEVADVPRVGVRLFHSLGYAASPFVAVLDDAGRVAFLRPLPLNPEELVQWHQLVPLVLRG